MSPLHQQQQQQPPAGPPSSEDAVRAAAAAAAAGAVAQHQHHSHEDYDWMGVLETLEAEHYLTGDGHPAQAGAGGAHQPQQQPHLHPQQPPHPGQPPHQAVAVAQGGSSAAAAADRASTSHETAAAMAAAARVVDQIMVPAASADSAATTAHPPTPTEHQHQQQQHQQQQHQQQQQQQQPPPPPPPPQQHEIVHHKIAAATVHTMPLPPMPSTIAIPHCGSPKESCDDSHNMFNNNTNGGSNNNSETKKQSRIERKRSREKQRRLDTNSQFTALAEIVRDVETTDFVEEAQYNLTKQYGVGGGAGMPGLPTGLPGLPTDGRAPMGMPGPPPPSEGGQRLGGKSMEHEASSAAGAPPPLPSTSPALSASNDPNGGSNKKLKSQESIASTTSCPSNPAAAGVNVSISALTGSCFNPSNRVDLIARTISQLTQFRIIRRRRTEELRDSKRQLCEVRKEVDELRRLVAHHKAVGMGVQKPQEKVMMMVPMMVPQDAVGQISQGYPAAHQYGNNAANAASPHHFSAAAPWMAGMTGMQHAHQPHITTTTNMGLTSIHHNHPGAAAHHGAPGAHSQAPSGAPAPAPGGMVLPPHLAHLGWNMAQAQPHLQQHFSGHASAPGGMPPPPAGAPQPPPHAPSPNGTMSPSHGLAQGSTPAHGQQLATSYASAMQQQQHQQQQHSVGAPMPPPAASHPPPAMAMYPQVSNGVPSVAFGLHPHQPQGAAPAHPHNVQAPSPVMMGAPGAVPPLPPPQQGNGGGQQQQAQPPSSDKPAAAPAHQGGGGNLAHCA